MVIDTRLNFLGLNNFFSELSNDIAHVKLAENFLISTCLRFVNFVEDFNTYRVENFLQKPHLLSVPSRPGGCITGDSSPSIPS